MQSQYKTIPFFQRTVHVMFGTLCILALVYCIVLLSLVFSVIERKQNTIASRDLTSQLSALEAQYANQISNINESALAAHEYTRVSGATFTVRKDPIASYTVLYAR